ncbi:MAG: hypothetical protein MI922_06990, partial [Bacteroidales bacterium]|nr:hypothetical protein [Bacteroidales bacterium]
MNTVCAHVLAIVCSLNAIVPVPATEVTELDITGTILNDQLTLTLSGSIQSKADAPPLSLIQGTVVLDALMQPQAQDHLVYDPNQHAYILQGLRPGKHSVEARFKVKAVPEKHSTWQRATVTIPLGRQRFVRLVTPLDREVELPGALRVEQIVEEGQRILTAILPPYTPLTVRWRRQVELAQAKLVSASQANTIVDVRSGRLAVDTVFDYTISQGQLSTLQFTV